jgi:hypothetical protein
MRRAHLGSSADEHTASALASFENAERTTKLAEKHLKHGDCRQAFRFMTLATANYHSGVAHASGSGKHSAMLRDAKSVRDALHKIIRNVQRRCLRTGITARD